MKKTVLKVEQVSLELSCAPDDIGNWTQSLIVRISDGREVEFKVKYIYNIIERLIRVLQTDRQNAHPGYRQKRNVIVRFFRKTYFRLVRLFKLDGRNDDADSEKEVSLIELESGCENRFCLKRVGEGATITLSSANDREGLSWSIDRSERQDWACQLRVWRIYPERSFSDAL